MKLFVSLLLSLCARSLVSGPSSPGSCLCIILVRGLGGVGEGQIHKSICVSRFGIWKWVSTGVT